MWTPTANSMTTMQKIDFVLFCLFSSKFPLITSYKTKRWRKHWEKSCRKVICTKPRKSVSRHKCSIKKDLIFYYFSIYTLKEIIFSVKFLLLYFITNLARYTTIDWYYYLQPYVQLWWFQWWYTKAFYPCYFILS